eukprot:641881-Hanusia_phi.AAC.1
MNWGIAIEVDGEQHFQGQCYGMQARQQQEWDRKVDAMSPSLGGDGGAASQVPHAAGVSRKCTLKSHMYPAPP